jgi:hypothetical protein
MTEKTETTEKEALGRLRQILKRLSKEMPRDAYYREFGEEAAEGLHDWASGSLGGLGGAIFLAGLISGRYYERLERGEELPEVPEGSEVPEFTNLAGYDFKDAG